MMSRSSGRGPKRCPAKLRPEAACTVQLLFPALVLTSEDVAATVLACDKQSLLQTCQTAVNDRGTGSLDKFAFYWASELCVSQQHAGVGDSQNSRVANSARSLL